MFFYIRFLLISCFITLFTNSFGQDQSATEQPSQTPNSFTIPTNSSNTSAHPEKKVKSDDDVKAEKGWFQSWKKLGPETSSSIYYPAGQEGEKAKICEVYVQWSRDGKRVIQMKEVGIHWVPKQDVFGDPVRIANSKNNQGDQMIFCNQPLFRLSGRVVTETLVGPTNEQVTATGVIALAGLIYMVFKKISG